MEAIELEDSYADLNEERCIGCGICAHHCPEEAIKLERTGPRGVIVPIPKLEIRIEWKLKGKNTYKIIN